MTLESLALQGRIQTYHSLAASVTSRLVDLRKERIRESMMDLQPVEHRMETVANIHGTEFINDSRSCTINSVWYALESIRRPVIWITGGVDRDQDYSMVKDLVQQKVKAILCLGDKNLWIHDAFDITDIPIIRAGYMKEAVDIAFSIAKSGDAVLLSPGCASFDMFENYEERGNAFKKAVKTL
jgi:UDP-N-acetylmuramoylalanine--D-glutamate ligase